MITKVINVNLHQPIYERLTAKQGDIASRYLLFHLLDGDKPLDLSNRTVRVYAIKPDKTEIFNDLTINDARKGYCTLELTSQCLASAGVVKMELYISEYGKVLTSIPFELEVIPCINTANGVISTNEFSALEVALGSLQDYDNLRREIIQARKGYTTVGKRLDNFDSHFDNIENKELPKLEKDILVKPFTKTKLKKYANFFGEKQIMVFGDSISWGSMVEDRINDSWVGILRKAINLEYGNKNYGFENFYPDQHLLDGVTPMKGKHTIVDNKFINAVSVDNIGRYKYYSQTANDFIEFTVDGDNRKMAIIYNQIVGGGKLSVEVNGTIVGEIDSNGRKINSMKSDYFTLTRYTNSVKLIKKDNNLTEIIGVMYTNDNTLKTLQNFSRSGSKLFDVDNSVLDIVVSADVLIMSLGHNDSGYPSNIDEFITKIDYLIEKCNINKTFVIVPNFIWYINETTKPFTTHLKRLAKETNGVYLDFPSLLEFSTPQEAINNGFLMDYSHPSLKGMEIIADTVINALGLGNKGKNNISDKHKDTDWFIIENAELKNGFTNVYNIDKYKFKYRRKGGSVEVVLLLNTNGAVSGTEIFRLPLGFRPFLNTEVITQVSGGSINKLLISEGGNISYYPTGTFTTIAGSFSFPCYE